MRTRPGPDRPWRGEPIIARLHQELSSSQGSKYAVVPVNKVYREVLELPGRYAFAALPCQAHGFWNATQVRPGLREKIPVVIGLFCGGAMEPYLIPEMLRMNGIREGQVANIEYRGGQWPGRMRATLTDGSKRNLHYSNYKDGAYNYLVGMYLPPRCATCIDGSCECSDLSVSDAWTRDSTGQFKFRAHSRILVRTDRGSAVVEGATRRGVISALDVSGDDNYRTHRLQTRRKGVIARIRVERMKSRHVSTPRADSVALDDQAPGLPEKRLADLRWIAGGRPAEMSASAITRTGTNIRSTVAFPASNLSSANRTMD